LNTDAPISTTTAQSGEIWSEQQFPSDLIIVVSFTVRC